MSTDCIVCLQTVKSFTVTHDARPLDQHPIHVTCIANWLQSIADTTGSPKCPCCQRKISQISHHGKAYSIESFVEAFFKEKSRSCSPHEDYAERFLDLWDQLKSNRKR